MLREQQTTKGKAAKIREASSKRATPVYAMAKRGRGAPPRYKDRVSMHVYGERHILDMFKKQCKKDGLEATAQVNILIEHHLRCSGHYDLS